MRADTIEKRPIEWLWKPYIQRGAINLLTGDPNIGKSTLVCELVASLTTSRPLPGQDGLPPIKCLILNAEDNAGDTIIWRLENQGADLTRVLIQDQREVLDPASCRELRQLVLAEQIGMVVIDPLQAWMGSGVDMHRANETRDWSEGIRRIAQESGCAFLICRHRRKGTGADNKLYAGMGSIDITGYARSEISAMWGRGESRYIERTKGNVGVTGTAFGYAIERHPDPNNDHGVFKWKGLFDPNSPDQKVSRIPKSLGLAIRFLKSELKDGPALALDLLKKAGELKISERTLKRAKEGLVRSYKKDDMWWWELEQMEGDDGVLACKK